MDKIRLMKKEELISCFQDTLEKSKSNALRKKTITAIKSNKVYKEGFVSKRPKRSEHASLTVCAGTTFETAKQYCEYGRIAVLNFANPENPGGGVAFGAMAQEECLCRSSNLYACISASNVFDEYYAYHRNGKNYFYSDRLIYTKNITIFKSDDEIPYGLPQEEWFNVDVITCAAPYLGNRKYTNMTALLSLFKKRIKNIFEAARENKVDVIILGAFGCGAFKNPPHIVAEAFYQMIYKYDYVKAFKEIVFAIKPTGESCPNISAFKSQFIQNTSQDMIFPVLLEYDSVPIKSRFYRIPALPRAFKIDNQDFYIWQMRNKYFGKQFSILGDSISTLDGYNPRGYKVFYTGVNSEKAHVTQMQDTWWDKVISFFGGELLVNNSWSGSRVTKLHESEQLFPSGCSDERTSSLHINEITPDVILIYLGTNDWGFGVNTGNETRILGVDENEYFDSAYDNMLKKLKRNYPQSEIWCFTLCETFISERLDFQFPHRHAGIHIEEYNNIIRHAAWNNKCKLIDLYNFHIPYDTIDGSHPTNHGMDTIATMVLRAALIDGSDSMNLGIDTIKVLRAILDEEESSFMDCTDGVHEYEMYDYDCYGFYYRCRKCGKEKIEEPLETSVLCADKNEKKDETDKLEDVSITKMSYEEQEFKKKEDDKYIGSVIDRHYSVLKQIAKVGISTIYLLQNINTGRVYNMKVCDKTNKNYNPMVRDMFLQEVFMLKKMKHPAIPQIVDIFEYEEGIFIIREHFEGETLHTIVRNYGAQPADVVIEWGKELCNMLGYLHGMTPSYIYGDMKPANVLLMSNNHLKVIEFGSVREYEAMKNQDICVFSTMGYAAPEQFGGCHPCDARTDIYGLGMTLHHLVTGVNPNEPPYEVKPICEINPSLPKGLEYIITKCTEFDPAKRYQNCTELLRDLERYKDLPPKLGLLQRIFRKNKAK